MRLSRWAGVLVLMLSTSLVTAVPYADSHTNNFFVGSVAWSPTGNQYAISIFGVGTKILNLQSTEIAFIDVWGTTKWSPDGSKIAIRHGAVAPQITATDVDPVRQYLGVWETTNFFQINAIELSINTNFDWGNDTTIALDGKLAQTQPNGSVNWLSTGDLVIVDSNTGVLQMEIELPTPATIGDIKYDSTGSKIAIAANYGNDNRVFIYDSSSGQLISFISNINTIPEVEWEPNGTQVAYGVRDTGIVVWDTISNSSSLTLTTESMRFRTLSWEGGFLAADDLVNPDRLLLRVWETTNWQEVSVHEVNSTIYDIALSPDGALLLYGGSDNTAEIIQPSAEAPDE